MPKLTGVTGYLHLGGADLVRATILDDGNIVTTLGSLLEDLDLNVCSWFTPRAVGALAASTGMPQNMSSIALQGPNGGLTVFAQALTADGGRNSVRYSMEAYIEKKEPTEATRIWTLVQDAYKDSTVAVAA